jgi:hypothetical protein
MQQANGSDIVPKDYPGLSVLLTTFQRTPAPYSPGRRESICICCAFLRIIRSVHLHAGIAGYGPSTLLEEGKEGGALVGTAHPLLACEKAYCRSKVMRQRFFLLGLTILAIVALAACSASLANDPGSAIPTIALHPIQNLTPTPTAPPYTIGAFASNETPNVNDSITIYVIFHINGKPQGGATVSIYFSTTNGSGIAQLNNQAGAKQTGDDGWAAFPITFTGLTSQQPVIVSVTVNFNGQNYAPIQNPAAFFTPIAPTPAASPTIGTGG